MLKVSLTKIPYHSKPKVNEWAKKPIIIGALAGLNAAVWGVLINFWLGLI